jgi:aminopeptidase N
LDGGTETTFVLGEEVQSLGQRLTIAIEPDTKVVHIDYASSPQAGAVQWLNPAQTAGGEHPFLFTQSQAILARTWVPCQDTPGVRITYNATVRVPPELLAVMSASNPTEKNAEGVYTFAMPQAIPSYLLALAVGDLEFRSMGPQSGVYAEPSVVEGAAWEFAETEKMMEAVAELYGPYRWGRYDILVLPPSFPFGGMENPRLTFATPTILAGDRSLVSLIAHELAHSWSGNLVTNSNWNDFWLNEGFTVYLERRIMEVIEGPDYAAMLALLGHQDLDSTIDELSGKNPADTHLKLDLEGRDPDDGMTDIAYEKGYLFLRTLEEAVGRERFDVFLKNYFEAHSFQSLTTEEFVEELRSGLLAGDGALEEKLLIREWIYGPGVPPNAPQVTSEAFSQVDAQVAAWTSGTAATDLDTEGWTTHQWLHFLRGFPEELSEQQLADVDAAFGFTGSGNSEVLHAWLHHVIGNQYEAGYPALRAFLSNMGRRKFLQPLYERLAETPEGLAMAKEIYAGARPGYHSVSTNTIDDILGWEG